jgi:hypothetical protein
MTGKQMLFVKNITKGMTQKDAAITAGYKAENATVIGSKLMRNEKIVRALEKRGLTDDYLADKLKENIDKGSGIKATADTALRAIEITAKMKGHMNQTEAEAKNLTQNNYYVELQGMSEEELRERMKTVMNEVKVIQG